MVFSKFICFSELQFYFVSELILRYIPLLQDQFDWKFVTIVCGEGNFFRKGCRWHVWKADCRSGPYSAAWRKWNANLQKLKSSEEWKTKNRHFCRSLKKKLKNKITISDDIFTNCETKRLWSLIRDFEIAISFRLEPFQPLRFQPFFIEFKVI